MELEIEHNLEPEELSKALVGLARSHHLEEEVVAALQKAMGDDAPKVPKSPAMRGLFFRFRDLYQDAARWCRDYVDSVAAGRLEKAEKYIDRPLTKEEIQQIQQAIRDRFGYLSAQLEGEDVVVPEDALERWKQLGLVDESVTPQTFAIAAPGEKLIRNAFVFGRLQHALDAGKSYEEVLKLALKAPLLKPDLHAIAIAEQQTATHITGLAEDLATEAGRLAAARNREIIRQMAVDFHAQKLPASVRDEAIKRELGMEIPERTVDTWQGFSSELYHTFGEKGKDWDRIAFFELQDAKGQGHGLGLLQEYGPEKPVYKMPLPTACPQCKHLYLTEEGTPRLFRLGEMLSWGNNIGRKPLPVRGGAVADTRRDDGTETLRPVCGQVHPWCECAGPYVFTGMEHWAKNQPHGAGA